mgnify:CR=1 FL=1
MPKNDDLTKHQYDIYRKTHDYDHPLEEEQAKIRREKAGYARRRRKSGERLKRRLGAIARPDDVEDWDEDPTQVEEERAARELRNAHAHKRRLKGLVRHIEGEAPTDGEA